MARGDWERLPGWLRLVLDANNTLRRLFIGAIAGRMVWVAADWRAAQSGNRRVVHGWLMHLPTVAMVVAVVLLSPMPLWAYLGTSYLGLSLLKIRTFLKHQAHEKARGRTVVTEDRRALALLFLNNNLHVVHHLHPRVPWYRLPELYRADPQRHLSLNEGYRYPSYAEIFARHLLQAKDPVPHPLLRLEPSVAVAEAVHPVGPLITHDPALEAR